MLDRLISGAGAISHVAARVVRAIVPGLAARPASFLLAGILGLFAIASGVVGLSADQTTLRNFTASEVATGEHGDRAFATVVGGVAAGYVIKFRDSNGDGKQGDDERDIGWTYFLIDSSSRTGVTVESTRSPEDVFTYKAQGVVVEDATYVAEDQEYFKAFLDDSGIVLDPNRYVDSTSKQGGATHVELAAGLPAAGTLAEIEGSRVADYLTVCSADANGDGVCSDDEVDRFDVLVFDPGSKKAVTVLTSTSPEFAPASFTGMLRRAPDRVIEARKTNDEFNLNDFDVTVSPQYLLTEGESPTELLALVPVAAISAVLALVIVIGAAGGYLRYRPGGSLPAAASTLVPGGRLPLRVTGTLRAGNGRVDVREVVADLVRFVMTPLPGPAPQDGSPGADQTAAARSEAPPTTLIIEREGRPQGVAVGRGELTAMEVGTVVPLGGPRPAIRLTAGTGTLLASFDSVEERDRIAAELRAETGIGGGT